MDNASATDSTANIIGLATIDGVLLLIVFITMMLNIIIIAALLSKDNSELVRSIRVILINILVACVVGGLASVIYHILSPILEFDSPAADSVHGPSLCLALVFLDHVSSSGRVLFTAYYGITVFIVVHYWHQPVLAPRNAKYFIIASAFVWLLALIAGIPTLVDPTFNVFCSNNVNRSNITTPNTNLMLYVTLSYFVVSSSPVIVTPVILIKTACYIKRKTIGEHRDAKKALVKFGLFLMIIQVLNALAQVVVPLLAFGISSLSENSLAFAIGVAISDLSRIPTNMLIIIFFKPVRVKVKRWLYCCHRYRNIRNSY